MLNMTKVVHIMMISSKTIRQGSTSLKLSSTIHPKPPFRQIHLVIHRPLWLFLPIWVLKGILWKDPMNTYCCKTRLSLFGKPNPPMGSITVLYPPISDGPFTDSKINLSEVVLTTTCAHPNKVLSTT